MRGKPELSFLEGGKADLAEAPKAIPPTAVVQKIFRLNWEICKDLKLDAARRSAETGKRVTETAIVERLLRDYLYR